MMRGIISFSVHHPVAANLLCAVLVAAGLAFGLTLQREFFPEVRPNLVLVTAPYPGASPAEVEQSLALKIEDALDDIDDVVEMNTTVSEGVAVVRLEFDEGVDIDVAVADVKREIDALQDLPEDSDRIVVSKLEPNLPVIILSLKADEGVSERTLKDAIRSIRDDLESIDGMGDVLVDGVRIDEITVELTPQSLVEHGLSVSEVADRVNAAMAEIPGGTVRTGSANISVRTIGAEERVDEVRDIVVRAWPDGTVVRLGDVAKITRGFEDTELALRLNGAPQASVTVFKVGDEDAIEMAAIVRAYVAGRNGEALERTWLESLASMARPPNAAEPVSPRIAAYELGLSRLDPPPGELVLHTDLSRFIKGRLDLLSRNALFGGVLVFLTLLVMLNTRVALWVTFGLGIAILGTLAFMALVGITLNLLTMFGLIIVLGLLVDDAIVVAENISAEYEKGRPPRESAVRGAVIVAWPVVATVVTTIVAFGALTMVQGQMGDLLGVLPQVVLVALGVSLVESLFILPGHMAHSLERAQRGEKGRIGRWLDKVDDARQRFTQDVVVPRYARILELGLKYRYVAMSATVAVWMASIGLVAGGVLKFSFLGTQDAETLTVDLQMPTGTPLARTNEVLERIETAALEQPEITSVAVLAGSRSDPDGASSSQRSNLGQVWLELVPAEERTRTSDEVKLAVREQLGELDGVKSLRIEAIQGGPAGPAIEYTLVSDTPALLGPAAADVRELVSRAEGVFDIADDDDRGAREFRVALLPGARDLGLTTASVARQVRGWVFGLEGHTFAAPDEDVDVRVRLTKAYRESLAKLSELYVTTPDGRSVPLMEVAELRDTSAYATVRRLDGQRAVTVSAEVDESRVNAQEVIASLAPGIREVEADHPGVKVLVRGRQKELQESLATLPLGILMASALIYVILALLFGSYLQPIVVMCAVPFAIIGMVGAHLVMGFELTLLSLIGFLALTGVVVNDSLILIEFYNHARREGKGVRESALLAGRARLRAIFLTTTTTVLGLLPLTLETSFQAKFLIPMALTISGGLISATVIILFVTPCMLVIGEDLRKLIALAWRGEWPEEKSRAEGGAGQAAAV